MTAVVGPSGSGKSTLMLNSIKNLLASGIDVKNIL